ncbi:MAG: ChaN family lipoprotein [Silicimonas sp.]|nr:ChaN family lipoprotein [Silicimonas sp.]
MFRLIIVILCLAPVASPVGAQERLSDLFVDAQIVILGEVHDNPIHHTNQARITADVAPQAMVFEMIAPESAAAIKEEHRADATRLDALLDWEASGWPDFDMYYPIFQAAPRAKIFGAAVGREKIGQAFKDGASGAFGADASRFGIDQPLDDGELERRLELQQEAHCGALPEDLLPGMVEAQRLKDAALARATLDAFDHASSVSDAPRVVVITGNGHARSDWGLPAMLEFALGAESGVTVATFAQFESSAPQSPPFTSFVVTEAVDRPDPCDTFK